MSSETPAAEPLSNALIRKLKGQAQRLEASVRLGRGGVSPAFLAGLDRELAQHELVKIRLFDLKDNEPARKAFKQGEWNQARIECQGDQIVTWINGIKAAELKDGLTPRGIIGLQVHGIGKKAPGEEIRWRAIRIKEL